MGIDRIITCDTCGKGNFSIIRPPRDQGNMADKEVTGIDRSIPVCGQLLGPDRMVDLVSVVHLQRLRL